jgi:hypothetical protein
MGLEKLAEADLQTANMNGFIRWLVSLCVDIQSNFMLQLAKMQIILSNSRYAMARLANFATDVLT